MKKIFYCCLLGITISSIGCASEDRDDAIINIPADTSASTTTTTTTSTPTEPVANLEINDYIWKGLNQYYYWQEEVDELADSKTTNAAEYNTFLGSVVDPSDFFDSLNHEDDRFSWIEENYVDLQNQLAGISASNGMKFYVTRQCQTCNELVAVVTYVLPESDAAAKGIERGNLITSINGRDLSVDNYVQLLYGDLMNYTVGLASYNQDTQIFESTGGSVVLDKVENFQENPIHKNIILEAGDRSVGYLMYNQFVASFDDQLIQVFSDFASQNITDLVLDLRYNGGGSVRTCAYLASMITGQFTDEIFAQQLWNSKLMDYFNNLNNNSDPDDDRELNNYFTNATVDGASLPGLNLSTVYILTTKRSASASELLINGLAPHINVVQIGETTVGKNVGSISIYDYIDNNGTKNPDHTYAMQPIVLKIANSEGFAEYSDGLVPNTALNEYTSDLGVLGDPTESFLAAALNQISGSGRYSIPKGTSFPLMKDPTFDAMHGMHIDFPQEKYIDILKN